MPLCSVSLRSACQGAEGYSGKTWYHGANSTKIALIFNLSGTHTFVTCFPGLTSRSFSIAREYWIKSWCTWGKSGVLLVKWWRYFKLTAGQLKLSFVLTNLQWDFYCHVPFLSFFLSFLNFLAYSCHFLHHISHCSRSIPLYKLTQHTL